MDLAGQWALRERSVSRKHRCKCGSQATHAFHPISGRRLAKEMCRECSERIVRDEAWRAVGGMNSRRDGRPKFSSVIEDIDLWLM